MNISYLLTVHNETTSLQNLLARLVQVVEAGDKIVILDDFSTDTGTLAILSQYSSTFPNVHVHQHALSKDYGSHKNFGGSKCKGDFIFQCDADELPTDFLLANLKDIIAANLDREVLIVPRINIFIGYDPLNPEHTAYGWTMDHSPTFNCLRANYPDFQGRIYKNDPRIKWNRRLHEKLEGHKSFAHLPDSEDFALAHVKTIEQQLATNKRYNEWFTHEENCGHDGFNAKK